MIKDIKQGFKTRSSNLKIVSMGFFTRKKTMEVNVVCLGVGYILRKLTDLKTVQCDLAAY